MSQALSVLPDVATGVPLVAAPVESAENLESAGSFAQALAGELHATGGGETAVAAETTVQAVIGELPPGQPAVAGDGKDLPPLPPGLLPPMAPAAAPATELADAAPAADMPETNLADLIAASAAAVLPAAGMATASPSLRPDAAANDLSPELTARDGRSFSAAAVSAPVITRSGAESSAEPLASIPESAAAPEPAVDHEAFKNALHELIGRATPSDMPSAPVAMPTAAAAPAGGLASPANSAPASGATTTLAVPLGEPRWGEALGQQVVWAVGQGVQRADLHLSPPELGPLSVRISLDQDQASVSFSSAHAVVRDAVEAALPRLRDMLGNQGITLADVNVAHQHSSHAQRDPGGNGSSHSAAARGDEPGMEPGTPIGRTIATGMLDVYA